MYKEGSLDSRLVSLLIRMLSSDLSIRFGSVEDIFNDAYFSQEEDLTQAEAYEMLSHLVDSSC